jgi:pilus assembly protein CpaC
MMRILIAITLAFSVGIPHLSSLSDALAAPAPTAGAQAASVKRSVEILLGKSEVFRFKNRVKRISVANPKVVEAMAASPREMVLNAKGSGETTVTVWDEKGTIFQYDVSVGAESVLLSQVRNRLAKVLPNEKLTVEQIGTGLAITGIVTTKEAKKVALSIGESYAPKKVVDNIRVDDVPAQVLLKVHFAEISKSGALNVGLGLIRRGEGNTKGAFFPGAPGFSPVGPFLPPTSGLPGPDLNFSGVIDFFLGSSNRSTGLFLRLLQEKGYLRTVAEPHLRVVSGKKAEFLVGGEVPVPVPGQDGQVTILYRPFGIQLEFTPQVKKTGYVDLEVKPDVSSIDQSLAIVIQGFNVPGFKRSTTSTRVELKSGQTMAISGLLSEATTKNIGQIPFLGDIPVLGQLFQSKDFQESKSELIVLITPQVIRPEIDGDLQLSQKGFMMGRVPQKSGGRKQ